MIIISFYFSQILLVSLSCGEKKRPGSCFESLLRLKLNFSQLINAVILFLFFNVFLNVTKINHVCLLFVNYGHHPVRLIIIADYTCLNLRARDLLF